MFPFPAKRWCSRCKVGLLGLLILALLLMAGPLACRVPISESQIFVPRRGPELSDRITRQNVSIPLPGGGALRGACFRMPDARALAICFYGNGETLNRSQTRLMLLAERFHLDVLCVDLRGYGASDGQPGIQTLREDALRVYDATEQLRAGRPVLAYGYSLGSISASHLAAHRPLAGLVLAAPISTFPELLPAWKQMLPWYFKPLLPFARLDPAPAYLAAPQPLDDAVKSPAPLLVIHGDQDRVIPLTCGRRIYDASPASFRRIVVKQGADHMDLDLAFGQGPERAAFLDLLRQAGIS